jgi:hypothetical protein
MPDNRGFYGFFAKKGRKNLQAQQAPSTLIRLNELIRNLTTDLTDHTEK